MPTLSWTVSFTMLTASNSPAKACAGHEANRTRRLDQPPSPVTQIHRPARLATRAASFRYGGRHHSGIPGDIIPLYPGDFVGIRRCSIEEIITSHEALGYAQPGWLTTTAIWTENFIFVRHAECTPFRSGPYFRLRNDQIASCQRIR